MKATEIIDKFKNVLLSVEAEEETPVQEELSAEVKEEVAEEQVELAQEETVEENSAEELAEEEVEEEVIEEAPEELYATKEELNKVVAEFKAMYEQLMDGMGQEEASDAPAELSSDKVELSEESEEISHSPEAEVDSKPMNLYSQNRPMTTQQRVFNKLFNN
jgi:type III secretion system FlhB-like substrate exporter